MLTDIERQALQGIMDSDFQDGETGAGRQVWSWSANPFPNKRTFSGAMSSLVKKGLAGACGEGDDACVWITEAGLAALKS